MVEPEFLDPGPNQPDPGPYPGAPPPEGPAATRAPTAGRRELLGLVVMLLAAALLPLLASRDTLLAVHEETLASSNDYSLDAWGQFDAVAGNQIYTHGPRFGLLLVASGIGFALLLFTAAIVLVGGRSAHPHRAAGLLAGAATGLVGLLLGSAVAMTLEIQSTFDTLRSSAGSAFTPVVQVRLRIGGAVWLAVAGVLAGGLAVSAALRVRRLFDQPAPGPVDPDPDSWR